MTTTAPIDWYQQLKEVDQQYVQSYLEKKGHLSFTALKRFAAAPIQFLMYKHFPQEGRTKAMDNGQMVHAMLFERDTFQDKYFVFDDSKIVTRLRDSGYTNARATGDYKKWHAEYLSKNEGKEPLSMELFSKAKTAVTRMFANPEFAKLYKRMNHAQNEHTVLSTVAGYNIKAVLDNDSDGFILDLKIGSRNSLRATDMLYFGSQFYTWVQQGLYSSFYDFEKEHFMVYADEYGDTLIRQVDTDALKSGRHRFEEWVYAFEKCLKEEGTLLLDSSYHYDVKKRLLVTPEWLDREIESSLSED